VLYTGTFEAYQGLDLLYRSMAVVRRTRPDAKLVMVGGEPAQVEAARASTTALGWRTRRLHRPASRRRSSRVSRRGDAARLATIDGTNTPLKIYQYLRSGRPIVATRLRTHTQVLDDETSILAEPTPEAFGAAIVRALEDPARAAEIGPPRAGAGRVEVQRRRVHRQDGARLRRAVRARPSEVARGVA
jgi:glycosyltransferase involved in cell wall biosynthesis